MKPIGVVSNIIGELVIIESLKETPPINEDSIVFKEDRHAVGKVFEVFGPVCHPFYVMRFNSAQHIVSKGIRLQQNIYFAPAVEDFTQYIFTAKLQKERGSDASWKNDQEPPPEALDYSDDEQEMAAKQKRKQKNQEKKKAKCEQTYSSGPMQRSSSGQSREFQSRGIFLHPSEGRFPPSASRGFGSPRAPVGFPKPPLRKPGSLHPGYRVPSYPPNRQPCVPPPFFRPPVSCEMLSFPPPPLTPTPPPPPPAMNLGWPNADMHLPPPPFLHNLPFLPHPLLPPPPPPPPLPPPSTAPDVSCFLPRRCLPPGCEPH
uniref:H/ACA ribonucleoprotein complex subunit n=2 Tax=Latimeria chalumnae TaxID=7897 RepID=H3A5H4_LATCH|nr:PREDICTED: H/ACA ribonucleoprotein complex non-core subunit NAF1 [Latimeria chalumnae]|eukprot:XP_006011358.1 PREDICTED: H/ACA ribonucleoprotein complex non-core subunit NAF1 [Latimeria chalumnae]